MSIIINQEHDFNEEVFRRNPADSISGRCPLPEEADSEDYVGRVKLWSNNECARLYPTAWFEQVRCKLATDLQILD
jgi:hypothetical protein